MAEVNASKISFPLLFEQLFKIGETDFYVTVILIMLILLSQFGGWGGGGLFLGA